MNNRGRQNDVADVFHSGEEDAIDAFHVETIGKFRQRSKRVIEAGIL